MDAVAWNDLIATDPSGESLGRIEEVHTDPQSGRPWYALVRSSSLGGLRHRDVLIPADRAEERAGTVVFPYSAEQVRTAPDVGGRGETVPPDRLREVVAHFEGGGRAATAHEGGIEVVLSEERLEVGRRLRAIERVRLRKVLVEEEVTVQVRLRREELEVVREPLAGDVLDAGGAGIGDVTDAVPESIVLYAEEPVVGTQVVPRERVRVERRVVTEQVVIDETVRHEDVSVDVDAPGVPVAGERRS